MGRSERPNFLLFITDQQKFEAIVATAGQRRAFDHHAHAFIAPHRIDSDTREAHDALLRSMVRATGNQPTATT